MAQFSIRRSFMMAIDGLIKNIKVSCAASLFVLGGMVFLPIISTVIVRQSTQLNLGLLQVSVRGEQQESSDDQRVMSENVGVAVKQTDFSLVLFLSVFLLLFLIFGYGQVALTNVGLVAMSPGNRSSLKDFIVPIQFLRVLMTGLIMISGALLGIGAVYVGIYFFQMYLESFFGSWNIVPVLVFLFLIVRILYWFFGSFLVFPLVIDRTQAIGIWQAFSLSQKMIKGSRIKLQVLCFVIVLLSVAFSCIPPLVGSLITSISPFLLAFLMFLIVAMQIVFAHFCLVAAYLQLRDTYLQGRAAD